MIDEDQAEDMSSAIKAMFEFTRQPELSDVGARRAVFCRSEDPLDSLCIGLLDGVHWDGKRLQYFCKGNEESLDQCLIVGFPVGEEKGQ